MKFLWLLLVTASLVLAQNCSKSGSSEEASQIAKGGNSGNNLPPGDLANSSLMSKNKLVWFGAHPDDEIYAAPLINAFCRTAGKSCVLVTVTKGEAGQCVKPGGCNPNLATVRSSELVASANYMGVTQARQYTLVDGSAATVSGVMTNWAAQAGNMTNLTNFIKTEINNFGADAILTMDPRHGTSCHADHRATAELIKNGAQAAGFSLSSIYMVESVLDANGFKPAANDSNITTYSIDALWTLILHLMDAVYQSQYTDAAVTAVDGVPAAGRTLSVMTMDKLQTPDARYDSLCP